MSRVVTAAQADQLSRKLTNPNGRYEIGQQFLEPFKEGRDYTAVGRKVMAVHHIEPGAPIWYDLDPQVSCTTIGERGGVPRIMDGQKFDRVELVPFPIATLIRISVEEPAIRRFDVLDRAQTRAAAEMAEAEDVEIFQVLRTAATAGSGVSNGVTPPAAISGAFSISKLSDLFAAVEDNDVYVENLLLKNSTYKNFRSLDPNTYDQVTRRELLKTGYMGTLWNSNIRTSKKMASAEIIAVGAPEFVGVLAVRIDHVRVHLPRSSHEQRRGDLQRRLIPDGCSVICE
jgi:HK97 family phage major capsid protein